MAKTFWFTFFLGHRVVYLFLFAWQ